MLEGKTSTAPPVRADPTAVGRWQPRWSFDYHIRATQQYNVLGGWVYEVSSLRDQHSWQGWTCCCCSDPQQCRGQQNTLEHHLSVFVLDSHQEEVCEKPFACDKRAVDWELVVGVEGRELFEN
jgi:hypothetical protein